MVCELCEIATVLDPASATELLSLIPGPAVNNASSNNTFNHGSSSNNNMVVDENYPAMNNNRGGGKTANMSSSSKNDYRQALPLQRQGFESIENNINTARRSLA